MHSHTESIYDRICYKQPLNNLIYTPCDRDVSFLSRLYEIYLSIKDLENLAEFNLLQNLHLQEVFHVYLNKFENAVTHLFLVILSNN